MGGIGILLVESTTAIRMNMCKPEDERYNRFLLTAARTSLILASNELRSRSPDSPLGLHIVCLLLFLQLRVYHAPGVVDAT